MIAITIITAYANRNAYKTKATHDIPITISLEIIPSGNVGEDVVSAFSKKSIMSTP